MASESGKTHGSLTRRQLLAGMSAVAAAAALAACGGDTPVATPTVAGTKGPVVIGTVNPTVAPATGSTTAPTAVAAAPTTAAGSATTGTAAPAVAPTTAPASTTVAVAPTTAAAAAGQKGGAIKFPVGSDPIPNPVTVTGGLASIFGNKALFNGLIRYNAKTLVPEGDLAEKWDVAADGLSITFTLRQNVKWHDGKPFTADDVKFTFDTVLDTKVNASFRSNIKGVTDAVVNSPTSVTLKLASPLPSLPIQLGYNFHMIP